jgi:hypothetical protein
MVSTMFAVPQAFWRLASATRMNGLCSFSSCAHRNTPRVKVLCGTLSRKQDAILASKSPPLEEDDPLCSGEAHLDGGGYGVQALAYLLLSPP